MTSRKAQDRAYVWAWLPGATQPVVAGMVEAHQAQGGHILTFAYGQSYLRNENAPALYLPELPKVRGRQRPRAGLNVPGVIRDAAPDAWGQRVIMRRVLGPQSAKSDPGDIPLLTYLLESGSDRPGALDFQRESSKYVARTHKAELPDLLQAADDLQAGRSIDPILQEALEAGSSMGGVRPKVSLTKGNRSLIAKFSASTDTYPVMKAEAVAMNLARRVGLNVAAVELTQVRGRDVLLIDRFDRPPDGTRLQFVSALTILELDELMSRYATYHDLADQIRQRFVRRKETLRELFGRIVFNILVGNTDDHARNHAAFWDGDRLQLTPAYDICPQLRTGGEAVQAMAIGSRAGRLSQVVTCVNAATEYDLTADEARGIVDAQIEVVREQWGAAAEEAKLTTAERDALWGRQILNPYATYGYAPAS